jgi:hypothetical protein
MKKLSILLDQLNEISELCDNTNELFERFSSTITNLSDAVDEIGKSWSKSWLGYHANVYYKDFKTPPPNHFFNTLHGFTTTQMAEHWGIYEPKVVLKVIMNKAGNPDISPIKNIGNQSEKTFEKCRDKFLRTLDVLLSIIQDTHIKEIKGQASKLKILSKDELIKVHMPKLQLSTLDQEAGNQGICVPPHIDFLCYLMSITSPRDVLERLSTLAKNSYEYIKLKLNIDTTMIEDEKKQDKKIFIGHGKSPLWRELKDFLKDKLNLDWEEFNRVSPAGKATVERLMEMLDNASFAFIIMTGEDEQPDETLRARENAVHEAGLFQGRLGFNKAILLVEDGCNEFSNIQGIGQLRFPKGNIKAAFEEVRDVLIREKIN